MENVENTIFICYNHLGVYLFVKKGGKNMNIGRVFKLVLAFSLSVILLLANFNLSTLSQNIPYELIEESTDNFDDPLVYPDFEISGDGISFYSDLPEISEEREVNWIDRIHNKPQYAVDFYNWLIENSNSDGALVTAAEENISDGISAHQITTFSDKQYFNFTPGISSSEIKSIARATVDDMIEENFYISAEWISEVYSAFDRDHPEVFWLSGGTAVAYNTKYQIGYSTNGTGFVSYTENIYFYLSSDVFDLRSTAYTTANSIASEISERDAAVNKIISANTAVTDIEKIKYINNYLTKNNYYNTYADTENYSPIAHRCTSALLSKTGVYAPVCDGYAKAFKVLCDKMNIPCVLVDGLSDGKSHMWNYAQVDGVWYAVDVTWNDPAFLTTATMLNSGYENENYLLVGSESVIEGVKFSDSHIVHNTVIDCGISFINEPLISKSAYNATVEHVCTLKNGYCSYCYSKRYDVNRDTEVNMKDLISLKNILLDSSPNGNSDCDVNGSVNSMDFVALRQYFWETF